MTGWLGDSQVVLRLRVVTLSNTNSIMFTSAVANVMQVKWVPFGLKKTCRKQTNCFHLGMIFILVSFIKLSCFGLTLALNKHWLVFLNKLFEMHNTLGFQWWKIKWFYYRLSQIVQSSGTSRPSPTVKAVSIAQSSQRGREPSPLAQSKPLLRETYSRVGENSSQFRF